MLISFSRQIKDIPFIESFLGKKLYLFSERPENEDIEGVVGWGLKETAKKAREFSIKHKIPYIALEDGFICSYGLRIKGYPPLSLIADPVGIYYDARSPSLLENMLNSDEDTDENLSKEAQEALNLILNYNISKFNYAELAGTEILKGKKEKRVLLVDQTFEDASVVYGKANKKSFMQMCEAAIDENPDADIYAKIHPDVISGKKRGYLLDIVKKNKNRIFIVGEDVNSISLLKFFERVYTVSSQMGFEALLCGKDVICFGLPFYAGWGLTMDSLKCNRRLKKKTTFEIFSTAYLKYCRYINPKNGKIGTIFNIIDYIINQRKTEEQIGMNNFYCVDFHPVKRKQIKPFIKISKNRVYFIRSSRLQKMKFSQTSAIVCWGMRKKQKILNNSTKNVPVYVMEDGFIRSVGLGAEFVPPMSIVIDRKGIYYDPSQPSELENILNYHNFKNDEILEAQRIIELIRKHEITKYNVESSEHPGIASTNKKVILVPGQVESDESVIYGGCSIKNNLELLRTVRTRNPDSYIIYKPHPDVLSKNKRREQGFEKIKELCDHIEVRAGILNCIKVSAEVHTLTSLSGFDALLRNKRVVTYGMPFYAGWGLTEDIFVNTERLRKLTLQEIVAGVLIIYPLYYDWKLKGFADCETIINRIIHERKEKTSKNFKLFPGMFKKINVWSKALLWMVKNS